MSIVVTGANVVAYVNGEIYASIYSFSMARENGLREYHGIDEPESSELVPTRSRVSVQLECWRMVGDGPEARGLIGPGYEIPLENYSSITLVDLRTQKTLFDARECRVTHLGWAVASRGVATWTVTLSCIRADSEYRKPLITTPRF
jgi:hypothetical protein